MSTVACLFVCLVLNDATTLVGYQIKHDFDGRINKMTGMMMMSLYNDTLLPITSLTQYFTVFIAVNLHGHRK